MDVYVLTKMVPEIEEAFVIGVFSSFGDAEQRLRREYYTEMVEHNIIADGSDEHCFYDNNGGFVGEMDKPWTWVYFKLEKVKLQ